MIDVTHDTASSGRIHLDVPAARSLSERALVGIGYTAGEAAVIADHVIEAALCGYEYSGLPKLLNIPGDERFIAPRRPMSVVRETDVSVLFDGGNNIGMLALHEATRAAIERATLRGVALIALTNSWMSGRGAHYVGMMAEAGLVSMLTVSASRQVAPSGGAKAALGTNPISFGFPTEGDPLVIDIGTSAIPATDLKVRARMGTPIPEGVAIDADGNPTTDAALARLGAILPFGGHKGYALSVAIRALGVLCNPALDLEGIYGYFIVAMKPDLFVPIGQFRADLSAAIAEIKAVPRMNGVAEVRVPGERASRERKQRLVDGIEIDRRVYDALCELALEN